MNIQKNYTQKKHKLSIHNKRTKRLTQAKVKAKNLKITNQIGGVDVGNIKYFVLDQFDRDIPNIIKETSITGNFIFNPDLIRFFNESKKPEKFYILILLLLKNKTIPNEIVDKLDINNIKIILSFLDFSKASIMSNLLDIISDKTIIKSDKTIIKNYIIQYIINLKPLYLFYLESKYINEISKYIPVTHHKEYLKEGITFKKCVIFISNVKDNLQIGLDSANIENELIQIYALLTMIFNSLYQQSIKEDYQSNLYRYNRNFIQENLSYYFQHYILTILSSNSSIVKISLLSDIDDVKNLFMLDDYYKLNPEKYINYIKKVINSNTLDSASLTVPETIKILNVIYYYFQNKTGYNYDNLEFIYLNKLLDIESISPDLFELVLQILNQQYENLGQIIRYNKLRTVGKSKYISKQKNICANRDKLFLRLSQIESRETGLTLLDLYLTKPLYQKYLIFINIKNLDTLPFDWLKKNPDIMIQELYKTQRLIGNPAYKIREEPEFKQIYEVFFSEITSRVPEVRNRPVSRVVSEEGQNRLLEWIIADCPMIIGELSGDTMTVTGCNFNFESIFQKIIDTQRQYEEEDIGNRLSGPLSAQEKIKYGKFKRIIRKFKKILKLERKPKFRNLILFYLTFQAEEAEDIDRLNPVLWREFIIQTIRDFNTPTAPMLNLVYQEALEYDIEEGPASAFLDEGAGAGGAGGAAAAADGDGGRAGHTEI